MTVSLELLGRGPSRPDLLEDLVVDDASLTEILGRWTDSVPVVVEAGAATGLPSPDRVAEVLGRGAPAVVDIGPDPADPAGSAAPLADLLVIAAHAGVGFGSGLIPRCADASGVWAVLSGAVAAMTGADVAAAIVSPDPAAIVGLSRSAREAIRDVITCVVVPRDRAEAVAAELAAADPG